MEKIKSSGFISFRDSKKPCYPVTSRLGIWDTYPVEIKKLADDFYLMTVKNVKTYFNSEEDKRCRVNNTVVAFFYGLKNNEYVTAPKNSFPIPASIYFKTPSNSRSGVASPAAVDNAPKVDVSGLKRIE